MQYKLRNDQLNQLEGDSARMDIGREEFKVFLKGAEEEAPIVKESPKDSGTGPITAYAENSHCAYARGASGHATGPNGEHV